MTLERTDEPGLISTEGGAKAVWTDVEGRKSAPLPDWVHAHLG